MKVSTEWSLANGVEFRADHGRSGYAHLKNYTVEYSELGSGPPLVMVPGLAGGIDLLGPVARILSKKFRVIRFQLRGEDDCFALRQRFGMQDQVNDLAELLDWFCLENPTVFGVSFGGVLALEFAARYPGRLGKLVVQGAGAHFERSLLQWVASTVLSRYPLPEDNPFINQFFNLLFGGRQRPGPLFEFVTRQCWQTDQSVMAHRFRMIEGFDLGDRVERIAVPSLVLAGERDMLVSDASLRDLCRGLKDNELVRIPKAGHLAFVTHAGRVAEETRKFLLNE